MLQKTIYFLLKLIFKKNHVLEGKFWSAWSYACLLFAVTPTGETSRAHELLQLYNHLASASKPVHDLSRCFCF